MKVCLFTTDWPPTVGGICTHTRNLSIALSRESDIAEVRVVAFNNKNPGIESPHDKCLVTRLPRRSFIGLFFATLLAGLQNRSCDVFHATSTFPIGFFTILIGRYLLRKPVVVSFYGTDVFTTEGSSFTKWAKGFTLRYANACAALTNSTRSIAASKYDLAPDFCPVLYSMAEDDQTNVSESTVRDVKQSYGISDDDFTLLFLGNLVKRKGAELLVQALSRTGDPHIKLLIVGKGPEHGHLEELIHSLKLEDRVFLAGRVADINPYYAVADAFSMPSFIDKTSEDIEGFGIVYLEAQLNKVPVIGTRSGGIPEAMADGKSGLLVNELDVECLAKAIMTLKTNPELCKEMGEAGRKFVLEKFSFSTVARNHIRLYQSLTKK